MRGQLYRGAQRLQLTCPLPAVVDKVREATATTGNPQAPPVALLAIEDGANGSAASSDRQQVATLLGLPHDEVPPVRLTWGHMSRGLQGALLGHCPQGPSDLEAKLG